MDPARTQFNEEERINDLKPDSLDCEKIARQDLFFVMGHQMTPAYRSIANNRWLDPVMVKNISNGWLWNLEAQFDEFALDFPVAPTRVLLSKTEN